MSTQSWQLHPTLEADSHEILRLPSAHLRLNRNASLHWFLLVPETDKLDLLDLPARERDALLADAARLGEFLKQTLGYPRVNVGALGLVVPQLHLHVIGRRPDDPCWPAPVWGKLAAGGQYSTHTLGSLRGQLSGLVARGSGPA